MDFKIKKATPEKFKTDALILPVFEDTTLGTSAATLSATTKKALENALAQGDIKGKAGEVQILTAVTESAAKRIVLMGLGKATEQTESGLRKALAATASALKSTAAKDAALALDDIQVGERDAHWVARQAVELFEAAAYTFNAFKSKDNHKLVSLKKVTLLTTTDPKAVEQGAVIGKAIANGMNYARDLGNTPPNVCNPSYLAQEARKLSRGCPTLTTKILDEKQMAELGMNSLLSVGNGSDTPSKLIIMEYKGGPKSQPPHVLVGKGITFDTGGISLKPAPDMDAMKWDMCGAASVFGTMQAVVEMKLPMNVVGVVAAAENMPSGKATRPGDIVTTMSGQTVEILNTDAEGRLVLCDALTYVERFKPASVVDIATLTGAIIVALGPFASGMMSNDEAVVADLQAAADYTQDKVWRLPLWDEYQALLDSPFADIGNIGNAGPKAGSITAACFLSRFTKAYPWAHLDVAGSAFNGGANKGATGRPVPLLTEYLLRQVKS
ncbi:leucyl aminopeptidase [Ketobacter sp.]|uniref:leucyl aminopeptidase n=1 Tax=Ketobacter sp. TaxID=2083498 RepID=UPI000F2B64B1|nr:leucyl aminopeptidase [Ketobacter sp.]RLT95324.1 MAG: leucyl aminopeptidase [Ketobacter sp.]